MRSDLALCLSLTCLFVSGCGGGVEPIAGLVPASGQVTFSGDSLDGAVIVFIPESSTLAGSALADSSGKFTASTNGFPGLQPGKYKVTVAKQTNEVVGSATSEDATVTTKLVTPEKYSKAETTDLQVEIPDSGNTNIALELK